MVMPVMAFDILDDPLREINEQLQRENDTLRSQLEEALRQPSPSPIHAPNPRLLSPQQITVQPGDTVDVNLTIRNIGTHTAFNILSQAVPSAGAPFTVSFVNNSNSIATIGENREAVMTLRISVNANADAGNHTVALTHLFRDADRDNLSTNDTLHVRVAGEEEGRSNLEIRNMTAPIGSIGVGETATISFYIHNSGQAEARNIRVVAAPEVTADIVPVVTSSTQTIQSLAPGQSHRLTFSFSPRESAQTRSYGIGFTVHDGELSFQQFTAINVYNPDEEEDDYIANLEIRNMTSPTGRIGVGQTATFSFYVYNRGDAEARNIRVVAAPESVSDIVPVQTSSQQVIQSLAPGQSHRLTFSFSPTDASMTRSYAVGFTVHYGELSFQQFAPINVYNPEQEDDGPDTGRVQIPRVIVSNVDLNPPVPRAGQPFEMEITFRNTSATRSVNNIRVLMEEVIANIPGQQATHFAGFNPLDGSNTLFLDYLAPLEETTMTLRFTTVVEANPGAHNMRFTFDYQDQDFASHDASQQISISVAQVSRLELHDVSIGGWVTPMVGAHVPFDFRIVNSGRVNIINIRVRTEGPFDVSDAGGTDGIFVGQINFQRATGFDGVIVPLEPGQQSGYFIVTGEDITGEIVEVIHPFTVFVEGGFDMGDFEGDWVEGGGLRPAFPGGDMGMFDARCSVTGEIVTTGYIDPETGEFVMLGEWCHETGAWLPFDDGFDFIEFIRRPIVWGPAAGVLAVVLIVIIVVARRKKPRFDFEDDEM